MKPRIHSYFRSALQSAAVIFLSASAAQAVDYNFGSITEDFTVTASSQARVQGVSTGTGTFSDNGFGGVYDRGAAQDALYMRFNLEFMTLAGATINGDVNLNFAVDAQYGGAINNGIIGTPNSAWTYPGSAPGITAFTPVSAPNATFTTGQTATWTIANSTFTGFLGDLANFNGLAVTADDGSQAHFSGAATLTGNYTTTQIRVIGGTDWDAASWDGGTKTLSIAGSSNVTDGNVIMMPGTTLALSGSATLGGGSFSGTFQNFGTISYGSSSAQTLSGAVSGGGSVTQTGSGTLTLSGSNTYTGATTVSAGKLILSGSSTGAGVITVADTASGKASMEVSGTITGSNSLNVGSGTDSVGALQQTAGSVTRNYLALGVTPGSYGAVSISGGSLAITGDANIASWGSGYQTNGGSGLLEISNGTVTVGGWLCMSRWGATQDSVLNVSGGSLTYAGGGLVANWNADGTDTSVITVSGTGSIATTNNTPINLSWNGDAANAGILNLNGGTVTPARVIGGRGFVNFDGGTLRANSDQGDFLAVNTARIYSGGATIDTNTRNITINQALLAPADDGVATIPVTDGGSGYVSAPILTITGGTGSGATAVANMISDGSGALKIGSVTVTSRGSYTDATGLAVAQIGGGATTPATFGTIALTANTSGGLTKNGAGTLTLNGTNTFSGGLNINEGLVAINGDSALGSASGSVTLNGGGIKGSAALTLGASRTITLGASGGYFSNGFSQSWTVNSQLTGSGSIGFNYDSSVNQSIMLTSTANDYSGETRIGINGPGYYSADIAAANIKLGDADVLPYGAGKGNVIVGYDVNGTAKAILDLNGFDTKINGLATNNAANASVNNSSATAATLTLGNGDATATFGGVIQNTGGTLSPVKTGSGTQTLAGANTYTGNTTVNAGTLEFTSTSQMQFVVTEDPANNQVTGAGTATFDGVFNINTDAITGTNGYIWTLVDRNSLTGESFGSNFSVAGFTPQGDGVTWKMTDTKGTWIFSETTGELTLDVGTDYDDWAGGFTPAIGLPEADDDNDGLTNFEEYAFGLIPNSGASVNPITAPLSKTSGVFKYTRRAAALATDVTYTYESSTTLSGTWPSFTPVTAESNNATPIEEITVTVPSALLAEPKLFIRVKAEQP